jgi:hypothetical protein
VAVVRGIVFQSRVANPAQRVIEPELDMHRFGCRQVPAVTIFRDLMRWLVPVGQRAVRTPMRSIGREIEEAWPSKEL